MDLKDIKLTENMINLALKEAFPLANSQFKNEPLPFKKVFLTNHAMKRFEERFGKGFSKIEISKQIAASLKNGYYSLSFKNIPTFSLLVDFGEVTASVQILNDYSRFNAKEEIYLVKTLYLKMNESFLGKMSLMHDKKMQDKIFEVMINDQFFKGKTESEIFSKIEKPLEKVVKRVRNAINSSYKGNDPIQELQKNESLFEIKNENQKYKFGDGIKPKPKEKIVYMKHEKDNILDSLLDESLFDIPGKNANFEFGDEDEEEFSELDDKKNTLGLDLDPTDFPW